MWADFAPNFLHFYSKFGPGYLQRRRKSSFSLRPEKAVFVAASLAVLPRGDLQRERLRLALAPLFWQGTMPRGGEPHTSYITADAVAAASVVVVAAAVVDVVAAVIAFAVAIVIVAAATLS